MLSSKTKFSLKPQGICIVLFPYAPGLKGETSKAHLHEIQRVDCIWGGTNHISGISVTENLWWPAAIWNLSWDWQAERTGGFLCNVRRAAAVGCWLWSTEDGNGYQGTVWRRVRSVVGEEHLLHLALYQQHSIVAWAVTAQLLVLTFILPLTAGLWHSKLTLTWRQNAICSVARSRFTKLLRRCISYGTSRLYAAIQLATMLSDTVTLNTTMTLLLLLRCRKTDRHNFVNSIWKLRSSYRLL